MAGRAILTPTLADATPQTPRPRTSGVFSARTLPIYGAFLVWGTGAGAQNLARPLFAYELEGSLFLVTVLLAFSAIARLVASPITGFMTDRWGRKPLLVTGAGVRGVTGILSFFADTYAEFFVLEFVGGMGIAMWNTSANILIADVTEPHMRGRVVAMRGMSIRAGQFTGPLLGALVVAFFDLRTIFLINGISKFLTLVIAFSLIKESREEPAAGSPGRQRPRLSLSVVRPFLTRAFILVILATFAVSMMGQGVFNGLLPIFAQELAGLNEASIGTLIGVGGLISVLVAFPGGMVSDEYGRKFALVPGLAMLAVSAYLLSLGDTYTMLLLMVSVYGVAWGLSQGTAQTYAMDISPAQQRGTFLGVWSLFQAAGGFVSPLVVGGLAQWWSFSGTFVAVAAWLAVSALLILLWAPETRWRGVTRGS